MKATKYLKAFVLLPFCVSLFISAAEAQTFEEYKKQRQNAYSKFEKVQKEKLQALQQKFDDYVHQQDEAFTEYLKDQWQEFQTFKGIKPPERPKPMKMPVFNPSDIQADKTPRQIPSDTTELVIKKPADYPAEEAEEKIIKLPLLGAVPMLPQEDIVLPLIQESLPADFNYERGKFSFYGNNLEYHYDPAIQECGITGIGNQSISEWWSKASETNYNRTVNDMLLLKDRLALNDWAYLLMIEKVAADIFPADKNRANLLTWFFMIRSGYETKIGYFEDRTTVLFPSRQTLYRTIFLNIDRKKYYMREYLGESLINTYEKRYPGASRIMDFNIYYPLNLSAKEQTRSVEFTNNGTDYQFRLAYNPDLIDFFDDYPVVDMNVYFDAALSAQAKDALAENILPHITDMSELEAANFLLGFAQKAFDYKIDEEQFGDERYLFPEETIHYPFCDCEDRSAFYTYLVKEFLDLEVIGLEYPWHIAAAVKFNDAVSGDYVEYGGNNYVVADPTFINAPVGRTMPRYKNQDAKVIELNNYRNQYAIADRIWSNANKAGAYRGGTQQDHTFDEHGNCYITGYFNGTADFGIEKLSASSGNRQCFLAKYDPSGHLSWAKNFGGNGVSTGISLKTNGSDLYAMGTFSGDIEFQGKQLQTLEGEDVFAMKLSENGNIHWINKADLSSEETAMHLKYLIRFNSNGKHMGTELFTENPAESTEGIMIANNDDLLIAGAFNNTTGLNTLNTSFASKGEMSYTELLKMENDKLVESNVDQSIAGLFAVVNLIKNSGMTIPGKSAQEALDKYNPAFKKSCPDLYKNIAKIRFLKNADGIITMKIEDGGNVKFHKVKVENNARIKVTSLSSGDEQINALSGLSVGKFVVWYDLNHIKMFRDDGNLLFDYDSDHTQKLVNMKEDILDM